MPYINLPFAQTHPGRLAALAQLFGMRTPAVETCRVLELGCASGDNLIPMALVLPDARFLGIDLSARQIEQGRQTIAALHLTNIELRCADIAGVDAAYGQFDYIVSHGIYSWAMPFAQLVAAARASLQQNTDAAMLARDTQLLGNEMLQCYAADVVELRVWSPPISLETSGPPTASPLARLQAAHGDKVTNLHQQRVTLDGLNRVLLPLLDGSRDRDALVAALAKQAADGLLRIQQHGNALTHGTELEKVLLEALDQNLPRLAKAALLLA